MPDVANTVYDLIGIGFGPSNLALAIAVQEQTERADGEKLDMLFLEAQPAFAWHSGMLLKDSQMQISFLKDLVTLRNPQSRFTFLNYLKEKDRLNDFVNLREFYPTRVEFNDYFAWVAAQFGDIARYNRKVLDVKPIVQDDDDHVELLKVVVLNASTGQLEEYLTCNLVVATGGIPVVPAGIELQPGGRVFHSRDVLHRIRADYANTDEPYRFVVVGSGQSAAEIFHYLISSYPNADVTAVLRQFAFKAADDSGFVNEIFYPHMVDFLYDLPVEKRRSIFNYYSDTNYSVVDDDLIKIIYRTLYEEKVAGGNRMHILPFMELRSVREQESGVVAQLYHIMKEQPFEIEGDAIVLATGYVRPKRHPLLESLMPYLALDDAGGYQILRDYRVAAKPGFRPSVFLQGFSEETHGLSDTLLSVLPIRATDILRALLASVGQSKEAKLFDLSPNVA